MTTTREAEIIVHDDMPSVTIVRRDRFARGLDVEIDGGLLGHAASWPPPIMVTRPAKS